MMQVANQDIVGENWLAQIIIRGVHTASIGHTLIQLMNARRRYFAEREDNANVDLLVKAAGGCAALPSAFQVYPCGAYVFAFSDLQDNDVCVDQPSAFGATFAIGGEQSYSVRQYNCAGWPQKTINQGLPAFPTNFRLWVR